MTKPTDDPTDDLLDDLIRAGNPSHIIRRVADLLREAQALEARRAKDAARKAAQRERSRG